MNPPTYVRRPADIAARPIEGPGGGRIHDLVTAPADMEQLGLSLAIFPRGYATHGHGAHVDREHAYYVVSGAMEVTIGGQTSSAGPGDVVFFPRGIEHDHRNSGEGDLVVLIVRTPVPATKA